MSREINFRACHMPFEPKGLMREMVYGKASSILAFAGMSPDKYILEQYTGLKDINGKEIYEGDILATSSMLLGSQVTDYLKVDWREDAKKYIVKMLPIGDNYLNQDSCDNYIFTFQQR